MVVFLLLYFISICTPVSTKIHRVHPHFHANFTIIDGSYRLMANCVKNTTVARIHDCVGECVREQRCQTFNFHRSKGFCELLTLSKFDVKGILEPDYNWVHYETDDNEKLVRCISTVHSLTKISHFLPTQCFSYLFLVYYLFFAIQTIGRVVLLTYT